jgi:glycosyltransferase involved in cell wall biosynthesis
LTSGGILGEPVRVGLDVTPAVTTHGGLARYTQELWRALAQRPEVDVHAFALGRGPQGNFGLPLRRLHVPLRFLHLLWRTVRWPRAETFSGRVDVVHTIALTAAPTRCPQVVTVHDLLPITHPHLYPPGADLHQRSELRAAAGADVIVTTCESTADEIASVAGFPRASIVVAYPGVFAPLPGEPEETGPVEGPYVLAVGQVTPRKGLEVLAAAAARLGRRCPPVLVVGPDWWQAEEVRRAIAEVDVEKKVRLLGLVDDRRLAALYRNATVVCHPSRAEGFGLTCLEAMAAGTPLLATDLPSVREVVDGDAVLVPVDDDEALAGGLAGLLDDPGRRAALAEAGLRRAALYSWERMAGEMVSAYRKAVAR